MSIYRILGLLLTASPIVISTDRIFFPYSILGLTLFIITLIVEKLWTVESIIEIFLWLGMIICILIHQPQAYIVFQVYFALTCYVFLLVRLTRLQFFIIPGFICSMGMIFSYALHAASYILLGILFFVDRRSVQEVYSDTIDDETADIIIPKTSMNEQENNFVIPESQNPKNMG